jgi:hypothetical protein
VGHAVIRVGGHLGQQLTDVFGLCSLGVKMRFGPETAILGVQYQNV